MIALAVAVGAAVGAPARYLVDRGVQARLKSSVPWGTLTVNVFASLVLGVIAGASSHVNANAAALIGTGFCGTLSTFSTFGYETVRLAHRRQAGYAVANLALSLALGIGAAAIGWLIGTSL